MEDSKHCAKCDTTKARVDFANHSGRYDGKAVWCKACMGAYNRAYNQRPERKKRNAELALLKYHGLSEADKLIYNNRGEKKSNYLRGQYKRDLDWYNAKLEEQAGCAICGTTTNGKADRMFAVDHDHACCSGVNKKTCGECVRGVLCSSCNV